MTSKFIFMSAHIRLERDPLFKRAEKNVQKSIFFKDFKFAAF